MNVKPSDPALTTWTLLGTELDAELVVEAGVDAAAGGPYCP